MSDVYRYSTASLAVTLSLKAAALVGFPVLLWSLRVVTPSDLGVLGSENIPVGGFLGRRLAWMLGR